MFTSFVNSSKQVGIAHQKHTSVARLKCGIIFFLWDGHLARPVRAGCPHHKSYIYAIF
ncbi:hypothetical protein [Anabaena azotica]|uniref:Uncharacterized protein n=1 Tax=Anabaena azotica FACHB-119 TaxID=947527 RepID=A0ABR8D927_9NOST|nr:hypothetical protein [Anabaena azotica]MBD2503710.1 hypothetical protein [Anabaena azotica FACHB-119]